MALQSFVARNLPTIKAAWLNVMDQLKFNFGLDTGVANAYVVALSPSAGIALAVGTTLQFTAANPNTGASTLNVGGTGAQPVLNQVGGALTGGELSVPVVVRWTGAAWQIVQGDVTPALARTALEIAAGVTPSDYRYPTSDVRRYGTAGDGATDDGPAIQRALNSQTRGGVVYVPATDNGYKIDTAITIPYGVQLIAVQNGLPLNRFTENTGININTKPGGVMFIITSTLISPIIMRSNSQIDGFVFWYPSQVWNIASLATNFTTYLPAIQLGDDTDTGPSHISISGCQFLGATTCIKQFKTDGTSIRSLYVKECGGVLMGNFLFISRSTDILHVHRCHFTPNAVTAYVADGSVGGDATIFRTRCAQLSIVFHLGAVDDLQAVDVFAFGVLNYAKFASNMYTGDGNTSFGGTFTNCVCDGCYQAFSIVRSSNTFPLNIIGGWYTPLVRPNGIAGDAATQAFIFITAALTNLTINVTSVRIFGTAVGEFTANYSGQRDNDIVSGGGLGVNCRLLLSNYQTLNQNTGLSDANATPAVNVIGHTIATVFQATRSQAGYEALAGGFIFTGTTLITKDGSARVLLAPAGGDIRWGRPLVALGGGAAPTLGTIGGTGPTAAAQNSWMRVVDDGENVFWVPVWK